VDEAGGLCSVCTEVRRRVTAHGRRVAVQRLKTQTFGPAPEGVDVFEGMREQGKGNPMGSEIVVHEEKPRELTREQIDLVKRTVARGVTDAELQLFLYTAQRTGLDPLAKQIHAIKRWNGREKREVMTVQTGIDGYRLIAERTGRYVPGAEPRYEVEGDVLVAATAYVKKLAGGLWHDVAATAYYTEYLQTDRDGRPTGLWAKMPRLMLGKCAEALALRRAFPAEMSGVYTFEEMAQAEQEAHPASEPSEELVEADAPALPPAKAVEAPEGWTHAAAPRVKRTSAPQKPPSQTPSCGHCGSINVVPDGSLWIRCNDCAKGTRR